MIQGSNNLKYCMINMIKMIKKGLNQESKIEKTKISNLYWPLNATG